MLWRFTRVHSTNGNHSHLLEMVPLIRVRNGRCSFPQLVPHYWLPKPSQTDHQASWNMLNMNYSHFIFILYSNNFGLFPKGIHTPICIYSGFNIHSALFSFYFGPSQHGQLPLLDAMAPDFCLQILVYSIFDDTCLFYSLMFYNCLHVPFWSVLGYSITSDASLFCWLDKHGSVV